MRPGHSAAHGRPRFPVTGADTQPAAGQDVLCCMRTAPDAGKQPQLERCFEHVHFHVVPRSPDMDPGLRGPQVFGHLGGDPAGHVPAQVMDQLAVRIGQALRLDP